MNRVDVIGHLQIIHTWATFALEKDKNFFTDAHMKSIAEWTENAITMLEEHEKKTAGTNHIPLKW